MQINDIIENLIYINNTLGEIYTKGDDSILLVKCRQLLYKITNDYQYRMQVKVGEPETHYFNENEDKKE